MLLKEKARQETSISTDEFLQHKNAADFSLPQSCINYLITPLYFIII